MAEGVNAEEHAGYLAQTTAPSKRRQRSSNDIDINGMKQFQRSHRVDRGWRLRDTKAIAVSSTDDFERVAQERAPPPAAAARYYLIALRLPLGEVGVESFQLVFRRRDMPVNTAPKITAVHRIAGYPAR